MAGSEPLKYFNAVTQLMTGNNATKQEPVLKINSANLAFSMREGNGTKGATDPNKNVNQVIQAALMDFGNGGDNYDLAQGVSRGEGTIESEGLTETEVKDLFEAVLGRPPLLSSDLASTGGNPDALKALVIDQLTKNGDLYVPLDFGREVVTKSNDTYNTYKNYKSSYDLENDREPTYETIENNMSHMVKIEGLPYDMVPKDPSGKPFMVGNPKKEYSYKVINVINPTTGKGESMPFDSVLEAIGRANGKASGGPFGIKPPPRKPGG